MPSKDLYRIMEWFPFETRPMDDEEREHWSTQLGYDLFIATCNDSTGKDMTATFWTLLEETP